MAMTELVGFEGYFACGRGIVVGAECVGRTYFAGAALGRFEISLPKFGVRVAAELEPPDWSCVAANAALENQQVGVARWGTISSWSNRDDGTQVPTAARIDWLRFRIDPSSTITRSDIELELDRWWTLFASWVSVFTSQDAGEVGRAYSGIRRAPYGFWECTTDGKRKNSSRYTTWPTRSENIELLDDATLTACITLTAEGQSPPDEWLFICDARALVKTGDYRRAVIDAGTAVELAVTELLDQYLVSTDPTVRDNLLDKSRGLELRSDLAKKLGAATIPKTLRSNLINPRNKATHGGTPLTIDIANGAIEVAVEIVEQAHPLLGLVP